MKRPAFVLVAAALLSLHGCGLFTGRDAGFFNMVMQTSTSWWTGLFKKEEVKPLIVACRALGLDEDVLRCSVPRPQTGSPPTPSPSA